MSLNKRRRKLIGRLKRKRTKYLLRTHNYWTPLSDLVWRQ